MKKLNLIDVVESVTKNKGMLTAEMFTELYYLFNLPKADLISLSILLAKMPFLMNAKEKGKDKLEEKENMELNKKIFHFLFDCSQKLETEDITKKMIVDLRALEKDFAELGNYVEDGGNK